MHCEEKLKLRSNSTSYYLIEVVTKAGFIVGKIARIHELARGNLTTDNDDNSSFWSREYCICTYNFCKCVNPRKASTFGTCIELFCKYLKQNQIVQMVLCSIFLIFCEKEISKVS